jgi:hypothetical protein
MAKTRTDEKAVLNLVINGQQAKTSVKELSDSIRKYESEIRNMHKADNPTLYKQKADAIKTLKGALNEAKKEMNGLSDEGKKFQSNWKDIAKGVIAGGAIQQGIGMIKDFGMEVVNTYTKYERFAAVLENTLGSQGAANRALSELREFAKTTPFALDELTESYVQLVNRGFQPSMEEMQKMGDLAASQGKDFKQLTEAVLDAGTGEFERLKEFGIQASKNGDKVSLSFKGITKEVKNSEDAIQQAVLAFGELDGVAGSTAKTSATLGGKISNLSDSWDQLLATMGSKTGGVIYDAVSAIGGYLDWLNNAIKSTEQRVGEEMDKIATGNVAKFRQMNEQQRKDEIETTQIMIKNYEKRIAAMNPNDDPESNQRLKDRYEIAKKTLAAYEDFQKQEVTIKKKAEDEKLRIAKQKANEEAEHRQKEREKEAKRIADQLEKEKENLKKLAAEMQQDFSLVGLDGLDRKLAEIDQKYNPLIAKAKAFKDAASLRIFETLKAGETQFATGEESKKQRERAQKEQKEEFDKGEAIINDGFDSRSLENQDKLANGELSQEEFDTLEYDLETERLIALQTLSEAYGESSLEYQKSLSARKLEQKQKELDQRQQLAEGEAAIEEATLENMSAGVSLLKGLVNQRGAAFKALLIAEKAIAISQVIMNTQKEIAGYYAAYSAIPGGVAVATGLATTAKVRAGISIATIVAQGIKEAKSSGKSGKEYALGGFAPVGPSHSQGGISLVNNLTGAVVGEIEGGEPILSKSTYANNKETIDALLYSSQRKGGAGVSLDSAAIGRAERHYRTGGVLPSVASKSTSSSPTQLNVPLTRMEELMEELIEAQRQANEKGIEFNFNTFEDEQKKRQMAFQSQSV